MVRKSKRLSSRHKPRLTLIKQSRVFFLHVSNPLEKQASCQRHRDQMCQQIATRVCTSVKIWMYIPKKFVCTSLSFAEQSGILGDQCDVLPNRYAVRKQTRRQTKRKGQPMLAFQQASARNRHRDETNPLDAHLSRDHRHFSAHGR